MAINVVVMLLPQFFGTYCQRVLLGGFVQIEEDCRDSRRKFVQYLAQLIAGGQGYIFTVLAS